jgi:hypothetical protein
MGGTGQTNSSGVNISGRRRKSRRTAESSAIALKYLKYHHSEVELCAEGASLSAECFNTLLCLDGPLTLGRMW